MYFELYSLNTFKRLLGNNFKITQFHSCTKAWKTESKSIAPEYVFAFQHHLIPVAFILKLPLYVVCFEVTFDSGRYVLQYTDKQKMNCG